ncbi:MAG: hypothetical protein A4E36_02164 [Methanoregulaceae archaeon PtaB.Bin009]|jgi:hypothetical protein|nr:MAG: hypothetical protein A4E36_02164 [Methanoregulaceae archaeon PtaB.Bin009]
MRDIDTVLLGRSDRTVQNTAYISKSYCILANRDPKRERYAWLLGANEHGYGCKRTLLAELGRLVDLTGDVQDMIDVAELLCEEKPTTSKILPVLRLVRKDIKNRVIP